MKENDKTYRREELEMLSTQALDDLLRAELGKMSIDETLVHQILNILEERESDITVDSNINVDAAWMEFKERYMVEDEKQEKPMRYSPRKWVRRFATVAAILCVLVLAAPKVTGIEWIAEIIGRWTQDVFEFFNPSAGVENTKGEYVFTTDHPGLQQIYDAVVELGVTQPVVPMWIPEEFELSGVEVFQFSERKRVTSCFVSENNDIIIEVMICKDEPIGKYFKDNADVQVYEVTGITHYVVPNNGRWLATWLVDDVECSISISGQESILYSILDSVYKEAN